ncbi:N-lysine methyltransferase [Hirschfeldia incana]|nr:N-lysine methyltransferase [Hirschfeldia incana]
MERTTPVRKPHTSTADLLTWSEVPPSDSPSSAARSAVRSHQPSDGVSRVVFGGQVTDEEVESLNKRKPCSEHKMKEITGSGIFTRNQEDASELSSAPRVYQQALSGISHISFGEEEDVSPKKPITIPEVAKQRELSGTMESESASNLKKQLSDAKYKEISGQNIFAPPPEIKPRSGATRALALKDNFNLGAESQTSGEEDSMKTAKKIYDKKFAELSGNDIFKGDATASACGEKQLSEAKLKEIGGNNIFADGKVESRDYLGGVRKPPGGETSIALV